MDMLVFFLQEFLKIYKNNNIFDTIFDFMFQIFSTQGSLSHCIDASDETVSNWIMFVKIARSTNEQNLVAHQQGNSVYFTSLKKIKKGEELCYWYCNDYTLLIGRLLFTSSIGSYVFLYRVNTFCWYINKINHK